ncbi:MAG: SDR family NAD(P)-dependent oxidoreductase [Longimicrobiales bacterium]
MDPAGKTALVTGGAHRVGRALSLGLARAGADVAVNYNRSAEAAAETVRAIEAHGRRAIAVHADVSRKADVDRLVREVEETFGRLDILVNSASLFERTAFAGVSEAEWDRVLGVNLKGPFLLAQATAPLLRAQGEGVIINIADLSAFQTWPSFVPHAVSKAGLVHLTRQLARALAPEIRANCVAPGTVLPAAQDEGADHAGGRERRTVLREGLPDDVIDAVLYLIRGDFVTGEVIVADGGRMLL